MSGPYCPEIDHWECNHGIELIRPSSLSMDIPQLFRYPNTYLFNPTWAARLNQLCEDIENAHNFHEEFIDDDIQTCDNLTITTTTIPAPLEWLSEEDKTIENNNNNYNNFNFCCVNCNCNRCCT